MPYPAQMLLQESLIDYIRTKGWRYKQSAGEYVIQICPFCHDEKWHFYIDQQEGLYHCKKCQAGGTLYQLKKYMGDLRPGMQKKSGSLQIKPAFKKKPFKLPVQDLADKYHEALFNNQQAMDYITGRGITQDSIKRFKLGYMADKEGPWISIPHYRGSRLINIKFRHLEPLPENIQKYKRLEGCQSILFNVDILKTFREQGIKEIFVTEGEIDGISLLQQGIENAVSGTVGAKTFHSEWIDEFAGFEKIYLCYDPDNDGQGGAYKAAKKLGLDRCFNIEIQGGYDINEFFNNGGDLSFWNIFASEAKKFDLPGVIPIHTAFELLQKELESENNQGLVTQWVSVNRLIKGFYPGDLIILSAYPKTGKTSFCLDLARYLVSQKIPVLFYCLEMRPERLIKKFIQCQYRKEILQIWDIEKARDEFSDLPLYFSHSFKKQKIDEVLELIRDAIKRYDLKLVIFDNIHFLVRTLSNVNEEIGQAVQGFKLLAQEMEIPIIVVAQPRKKDSFGSDKIMNAEDIKYSNAVHADCDQMIILYRKRIASKAKDVDKDDFVAKDEALDPITLVRIEAHRYGAGGETLLYFHGEYSRFDLIENKKK